LSRSLPGAKGSAKLRAIELDLARNHLRESLVVANRAHQPTAPDTIDGLTALTITAELPDSG
jgi:hypothetical protein